MSLVSGSNRHDSATDRDKYRHGSTGTNPFSSDNPFRKNSFDGFSLPSLKSESGTEAIFESALKDERKKDAIEIQKAWEIKELEGKLLRESAIKDAERAVEESRINCEKAELHAREVRDKQDLEKREATILQQSIQAREERELREVSDREDR